MVTVSKGFLQLSTRKETYQCHTLAHGSWEGGSIGIDDTAWRERVFVLLGKVKKPVLIPGPVAQGQYLKRVSCAANDNLQQRHAIEVGIRHSQLCN